MEDNSIYKFLKEEGLTDLAEKDFVTKYTNRKELLPVFKYLKDNDNTDLEFEAFSNKYFPLPKSAEGSTQGLENTSQTSGTPSQATQKASSANQFITQPKAVANIPTPQQVVPISKEAYKNAPKPLKAIDFDKLNKEVKGKLYPTSIQNAEAIVEEKRQSGTLKEKEKGSLTVEPLLAGLYQASNMVNKIPRYVYGAFAAPQNAIASLTGYESLRANYDKVTDGEYNPLGYVDALGDEAVAEAAKHVENIEKFNKGVFESLKSGDLADAGKQIWINFVQSAPSMAVMYATGGIGSAAKLGTAAQTALNTLPFAAGKYDELQKDVALEDTPDELKVINAAINGYAEIFLESKMGTKAIVDNILQTIKKDGVEVAVKNAKKTMVAIIKESVKRVKPLTGSIKNGIEEGSTTVLQNFADKVTIKPNKDLYENLAESIATGAGTGFGISSLGVLAVSSKNKAKLNAAAKKRDAIVADLDNDAIPTEVRVDLQTNLSDVNDEITTIIEDTDSATENLTDKEKDSIVSFQNSIEDLEKALGDNTISESTKDNIRDKIAEYQTKLDEITITNEVEVAAEQVDSRQDSGVVGDVEFKVGDKVVDNNGIEYTILELNTSRKGTPQATVKLPNRTEKQLQEAARINVFGRNENRLLYKSPNDPKFLKEQSIPIAQQLSDQRAINDNISSTTLDLADLKQPFKETPQSETNEVQEDYTPTEQDTQVKEDIKQDTTFWQDLSNAGNRATRLTTLEARIKQSFKDSGNLSIKADGGKEQAKQMRDITEYAILKIADGTIKTAQAFVDAVKGLGITNEDIAKKAYYNATTAAEEYSKTNPSILNVQRRQGEVIINLQDKKVSDATTKVTAKTVKSVTEGGIKGTVTLTNKEALKTQIATLNRGIKEGISQQKGTAKEAQTILDDTRDDLQNVINSISTSDVFKGVKVPANAVARLTANLNKAKTRTQVMRFTEDFQKFVDDVDHFNKVDKVRNLKGAVRNLAKKPNIPIDLKKQLRDIGKIDERYINDLDEFAQLLEDVSKLMDAPTNRLREADFLVADDANRKLKNLVEKQIEKASKEYQENKIEALKEKLKDSGIDTTTLEEIYSNNGDGLLDALQLAYDNSTNKESKADKHRAAAKVYQSMLDEVDTTDFIEQAQSDFKDIQDLNIDQVPDKYLVQVLAGLANLVSNNSLTNLGRIAQLAKIQKNSNNAKLIAKAKSIFRTPSVFFSKVVNKMGTGTMRIVNNINSIDGINAANELFGLTDLKLGTRKTNNEQIATDQEIEKIFKANPKDFDNPVNNLLLGVYRDIVQFRESWTADEIANEYPARLKAWAKSLDIERKLAETNPEVRERAGDYLVNLEKALNKIVDIKRDADGNLISVTPKMSPDEVFKLLPKGLQEYSKQVDIEFNGTKEALLYNATAYNNQDVEDDLANYSPRMYRSLPLSDTQGISAKAKTLGFSRDLSVQAQLSGSGKSRKISGENLPANQVLDADFISKFKGALGLMRYDINTQPARFYSEYALDLQSSPFVEQIGNQMPFINYDKVIDMKTKEDAAMIGGVQIDKAAARRFFDLLGLSGVARALGGFGQILKQAAPLIDVEVRLKNRSALVTATQQLFGKNSQNIKEILKLANTADRDLSANLTPEGIAKRKNLSDKKLRSALSKLGYKAEEIITIMADFSLLPLKLTDKGIANIGWLSFYIDHQLSAGKPVNIDAKNLDRAAFDYADTMASVTMGESDPALRSQLNKSDYIKFVMPFLTFAFNSKLDLAVNISKGLDKSNLYKREALRGVAGNMASIMVFSAIAYSIRALADTIGVNVLIASIIKHFKDEEEKEEMIAFVKELQVEKTTTDRIRALKYLGTELLFGSITGQIGEHMLNPVTDMAISPIYTEDQIKKAQIKPQTNTLGAAAGLMGIYGIPIGGAEEVYNNFGDAFQSDEDFIGERYGVSDASGKEIVVNGYRLDSKNVEKFARPEFSKNMRKAALAVSVISEFGASSQELNSFMRSYKYYETRVVDKMRGRAKDKERILKDAVDLSKIKIGNREVKLTLEQLDNAIRIREGEVTKLRKEKDSKTVEKMLTKENYETWLKDMATNRAKQAVITSMKLNYQDEADKQFKKREQEIKDEELMRNYKEKK